MSRRRETQMVPRETTVGMTCDGCGRTADGEPDDWHSFGSHHNDWGNDSCESSEHWDVCSGRCYLDMVRQIVDDYGTLRPHPTLEVDWMSYNFARSLLTAAGERS